MVQKLKLCFLEDVDSDSTMAPPPKKVRFVEDEFEIEEDDPLDRLAIRGWMDEAPDGTPDHIPEDKVTMMRMRICLRY